MQTMFLVDLLVLSPCLNSDSVGVRPGCSRRARCGWRPWCPKSHRRCKAHKWPLGLGPWAVQNLICGAPKKNVQFKFAGRWRPRPRELISINMHKSSSSVKFFWSNGFFGITTSNMPPFFASAFFQGHPRTWVFIRMAAHDPSAAVASCWVSTGISAWEPPTFTPSSFHPHFVMGFFSLKKHPHLKRFTQTYSSLPGKKEVRTLLKKKGDDRTMEKHRKKLEGVHMSEELSVLHFLDVCFTCVEKYVKRFENPNFPDWASFPLLAGVHVSMVWKSHVLQWQLHEPHQCHQMKMKQFYRARRRSITLTCETDNIEQWYSKYIQNDPFDLPCLGEGHLDWWVKLLFWQKKDHGFFSPQHSGDNNVVKSVFPMNGSLTVPGFGNLCKARPRLWSVHSQWCKKAVLLDSHSSNWESLPVPASQDLKRISVK